MKTAASLISAMLLALVAASCSFGGDDSSSYKEQGMRIVSAVSDSMQYGVCLEFVGSDSLRFLRDDGDTVWYHIAPNADVAGSFVEGDRLALMLRAGSRDVVQRVINTSMLVGEWVEPDPLAEGNVKGIMIADGGTAQTINISDLRLDSWRISNGHLLMHGTFGMGANENFIDTFVITRLTRDTLFFNGTEGKHYMHRLRPGEIDYESAAYDFNADPTVGQDFNPLVEGVEVAPDVYGDGPVY